MKKKGFHIFTILLIVLIILSIILGFILYDLTKIVDTPIDLGDTKLIETITVNNHSMSRITCAYNIKQNNNEIILTIYQHTSPVKTVSYYTFENDKLSGVTREIHYSTKLEAIVNKFEINHLLDIKVEGNILTGIPTNEILDYNDTKETLYSKLDNFSNIYYKLDDNENIISRPNSMSTPWSNEK